MKQPFTAEWLAAARRMQARNHLPCQYYNVVIDNSNPITSAGVRTWKPPVYTPSTTSTTAATAAATVGTANTGVVASEVMLADLQ
jgi:hypothetical protein